MSNCNQKITHKRSMLRKPDWLKIKLHNNEEFSKVSEIVNSNSLHTICSSGKCPNMAECWGRGTATFMIMGDICTRKCKFCATKTGVPQFLDENEPEKLARSIKLMKLKHAVVTSVDRDDLSDGGAGHWAKCVNAVKDLTPETTLELLIPDFDATKSFLDVVVASKPDIIGHNIETVRRLTPSVRSRAKYDTSLEVLRYLASQGVRVKSGIMVGLGETKDEIFETLDDLRAFGCDIITIGQYLQPTLEQLPVERYVTPEEFEEYKIYAYEIGFSYAECGPLVRSSYMAENALKKTKLNLRNI
ncbi:MAG: lipoyl synthase [Rikenellaceae bacterium]